MRYLSTNGERNTFSFIPTLSTQFYGLLFKADYYPPRIGCALGDGLDITAENDAMAYR